MDNIDSPTPPKKPRVMETTIIQQAKSNQFLLPNKKSFDNVQPQRFTKVQRLLSMNGKQAAESLQNMPYASTMKFVPNKEINISNKLQKLKLKSPDGRDLGEINVKLFPQQVDNIGGKTITLKKHSILEKLENQQAAISILKLKNKKISQEMLMNVQQLSTQSLPTTATVTPSTSNSISLSSICALHTTQPETLTTNACSNTNSEQKMTDSEKTKVLFKHSNDKKCSTISNAPANSKVILIKVDKQLQQQQPGLVKDVKSTQEDIRNLLESPPKSKVVMVRAENCDHLNSMKKKTSCSTLVELRSYPSNKESGNGINSTSGTSNSWKYVEVVSRAVNQGGKTSVMQSVANGKCDKKYRGKRDMIPGLVAVNEDQNVLPSKPLTIVKTYGKATENGAKSNCNEEVIEPQTKSMEVTKIIQRNPSGIVKSKPEITQCVTITKNSAMVVEKQKGSAIIEDKLKTQIPEAVDNSEMLAKEEDKCNKNDKNLRENIMVILHGDADTLDNNKRSKSVPHNDATSMEVDYEMEEETNPSSRGSEERQMSSIASNETRIKASRPSGMTYENSADILERALSTLPDQEMREKALKALADCGIGVRRQVPVPQTVSVNDSVTQTTVFGLYKPDMLIEVSENSSLLNNLQITKQQCLPPAQPFENNVVTQQNNEFPWIGTEDSFPLDMFDPSIGDLSLLLKDCNSELAITNVNKINNLLSKPDPKVLRIFEQLEKDYKAAKTADNDGFTGIHRAVLSDNIKDVQRQLIVLKALKENVDLPTSNGKTSLELAVLHGASPDIVRYLLKEGAKPAFPMKLHESALVIACKMSSSIVPELIKHVNPPTLLDILDSEGFAPLHYCAQLGNSDAVKMLVSAGANVNLRDAKSGRTPLFHALENRHIELGWHLVENGASLNITNFAGQSPAALVEEYRSNTFADKFNQLER